MANGGDGASLGSYFCEFSRILAVIEAKTGLQKQLWQPNLQKLFLKLSFVKGRRRIK